MRTSDLTASQNSRLADGNSFFMSREACNRILREAFMADPNVEVIAYSSGLRTQVGKLSLGYAENGDLNSLSRLINLGMNANFRDGEFLHLAAKNGHEDIVQFLLEKGADPCSHNNRAIRYAQSAGHENIAILLNDAINKSQAMLR